MYDATVLLECFHEPLSAWDLSTTDEKGTDFQYLFRKLIHQDAIRVHQNFPKMRDNHGTIVYLR